MAKDNPSGDELVARIRTAESRVRKAEQVARHRQQEVDAAKAEKKTADEEVTRLTAALRATINNEPEGDLGFQD